MRQYWKYSLYALLICSLIACNSSKEKDQQTQVRFFNSTDKELQVELKPVDESGEDERLMVKSSDYTEYMDLSPASYEISFNTGDQKILSRKKGLARGEKYTAIVYGKPEFSSKVNEASFSHKLHSIVEGAENYSKNAYLPSEMIFSDETKLKKGITSIRAFHSAVGVSPVTIKLKTGKKAKSLSKGLAYAKPNLGKHFKSGNKTVEVFIKGAKEAFITRDFEFKSQKSYLIILHLKDGNREISILEN